MFVVVFVEDFIVGILLAELRIGSQVDVALNCVSLMVNLPSVSTSHLQTLVVELLKAMEKDTANQKIAAGLKLH